MGYVYHFSPLCKLPPSRNGEICRRSISSGERANRESVLGRWSSCCRCFALNPALPTFESFRQHSGSGEIPAKPDAAQSSRYATRPAPTTSNVPIVRIEASADELNLKLPTNHSISALPESFNKGTELAALAGKRPTQSSTALSGAPTGCSYSASGHCDCPWRTSHTIRIRCWTWDDRETVHE